MFKQMVKRNIRQPLPNIAVILFAAVLAVVLCFLHQTKEAELNSYKEAYAAVPVFYKVTDLDGSKVSTPGGIEGWIVEQFTQRGVKPTLAPYVGQLHTRVSYYGAKWNGSSVDLVGISSTYVAEELTAGWGGSIRWAEGYDESILASDEFVCIVPESLGNQTELELEIEDTSRIGDRWKEVRFSCKYKVVGIYTDPGNKNIYCSFSSMEWIYIKLNRSKPVEAIGAILADNNEMEGLRATVAKWFAEPNPAGEPTPWGRYGYDYFTYAMDIDDTMLRNLSANMQNTIRLNQIARALVFVLSAGAGFLIGFLVIRSRKREIALMRTLGASHRSIFWTLSLEQIMCIALGIVVGGSYVLWQPMEQLFLFGIIYFVGLSIALQVFLGKNLFATIKEDE